MRRIGIIAKQREPRATEAALELVQWLRARGLDVMVQQHVAARCQECAVRDDSVLARDSDLVVVLGGDGTLLYAARLVGPRGTPIFPVNLGHLGFLCNSDVDRLLPDLEAILAGSFTVVQRMLLQAEIWRGDEMVNGPMWALNDVVIHVGSIARTLTLRVSIDGDLAIPEVRADGLIISSPTGSTAYNLSAGGPILTPDLQAMILAPMLPLSLTQRPLVVDGHHRAEIEFVGGLDRAFVTLDGQDKERIIPGDRITVRRADAPIELVHMDGRTFYQVLREKMGWAIKPGRGNG